MRNEAIALKSISVVLTLRFCIIFDRRFDQDFFIKSNFFLSNLFGDFISFTSRTSRLIHPREILLRLLLPSLLSYYIFLSNVFFRINSIILCDILLRKVVSEKNLAASIIFYNLTS